MNGLFFLQNRYQPNSSRFATTKTEEVIQKEFPDMSEVHRVWLYSFIAQGCSGILNHWISDGLKESAKEISEFINRLISSILKNL